MHRNEGVSMDRSSGVNLFKTTPPFSVCSPEFLNSLQEEIMGVLAKYNLPILDQSQDTRDQLKQLFPKCQELGS